MQTSIAHCWAAVMKFTVTFPRGLGEHRAQEVARAVGLERGQHPQRAVAVHGVAAAGRDQQRLAHLELGEDVVAVRAAADVAVDLGGERESSGVPRRTSAGAVTSRGSPLASTAGCRVEPEPVVGPHRPRVGRGEDDLPARVRAVLVRAPQQLRADAARLQAGPDDEQRQAPDVLAPQRQRAAREPVLVLGHPRAAGVAAHEVAEADRGHRRVRERLHLLAEPALEVGERLVGEVERRVDVVLGHGADHRHDAKTRLAAMPGFEVDGQRLAYTVYGEGPRVTVLLHGLLFNQRMHEALARALAARGNRVVTLDLLGHGDSDRPADKWRYSMPAFGRQVDRAARPPRRARGGRGRDLAGRERGARGRRGRRRSACAGW